jgi:hypothetical protein
MRPAGFRAQLAGRYVKENRWPIWLGYWQGRKDVAKHTLPNLSQRLAQPSALNVR